MNTTRIGPAEILWALAIFAVSVAYLGAVPYPLGSLDEGLFLYEAKRILHGEVMYRDIFEIAAPGSYYLVALAFTLFGTTMTVARTTAAFVQGLIAVLGYVAARRLRVSRWLSLAVAIGQLVCQAAWPYASPHWVGTLVASLLFVVLIRRPALERWRWYFLPGALLGTLALVQHQKALIIAVGVAAILAFDYAVDLRFRCSTRFAALARSTLSLAGGTLLIAIPAFGLLIAGAGLDPVFRCLVAFPLFNYHNAANEIVWGDINLVTLPYARRSLPHLLECLPIVLLPLLVAAGRSFLLGASREPLRKITLLLVFCVFSIASIAYHPDFIHLAIIAQPFFLAAALEVQWTIDRVRPLARWRTPLAAAVSVVVMAVWGTKLGDNLIRSRRVYAVSAETAFGRVHFRKEQETQLFRALRKQLDDSGDRQLFIYPGPPSLYLLTGAENPTRYQFLLVPYHDRSALDEVVRDLERKRARFILTPPMSNVADPVVDYAKQKYRRTVVFGMDLYERNDRGAAS